MPAQQDVVRLDVPVQHPRLVRGGQRAQHGQADTGRLPRVEGALAEPVAQRLAADQLHDDPRAAVLHHHVVHGDDGGMVDGGGGAGLAPHPLVDGLPLLLAQLVGYPGLLDGHFAVDDLVPGPPDGAHAAVSEPGQQAVTAADGPAGRGAAAPGAAPCGGRGGGVATTSVGTGAGVPGAGWDAGGRWDSGGCAAAPWDAAPGAGVPGAPSGCPGAGAAAGPAAGGGGAGAPGGGMR